MLTNKKIAFTLVELIMVMAIIGILMLGMTVYLGNGHDRATSIEAEGCANALGGALSNYTFYALTSRNLRIRHVGVSDITQSPTYYYVELTGVTNDSTRNCTPQNAASGYLCQEIILGYATGYDNPDSNRQEYETINVSNTCRHGHPYLGFYRDGGQNSGDIEFIRMNKGFTPREVNAEKVFFLKDKDEATEYDAQLLTGDIIVVLCGNESCSCTPQGCWKQIGKRQVDARSQTISFKKCRYYESNGSICKTRENCSVYNSDDPTICDQY